MCHQASSFQLSLRRFVPSPSWLGPGPSEQPPHQSPSCHVGSSSTSPCPPRSPPPLSRPRLRTRFRLCGAPRILLEIVGIRRHLLGCGHNSDILLAPKASPDLRGYCCYCFPCRGPCPGAPSGAFSLACGEVPPTRSSLFISRDGAPGAIVGAAAAAADSLAPSASSEVFWCPSTTSMSCPVAQSSDRDLFSVPLLGRAIPSSVQSPHPLAGAVLVAVSPALARVGYRLPPAQAYSLLGTTLPAPSLVQLLLRPIPPPRSSLRIGPRSHHRARLLGPLTETDLAVYGLDA